MIVSGNRNNHREITVVTTARANMAGNFFNQQETILISKDSGRFAAGWLIDFSEGVTDDHISTICHGTHDVQVRAGGNL